MLFRRSYRREPPAEGLFRGRRPMRLTRYPMADGNATSQWNLDSAVLGNGIQVEVSDGPLPVPRAGWLPCMRAKISQSNGLELIAWSGMTSTRPGSR